MFVFNFNWSFLSFDNMWIGYFLQNVIQFISKLIFSGSTNSTAICCKVYFHFSHSIMELIIYIYNKFHLSLWVLKQKESKFKYEYFVCFENNSTIKQCNRKKLRDTTSKEMLQCGMGEENCIFSLLFVFLFVRNVVFHQLNCSVYWILRVVVKITKHFFLSF